MASIGQRARLIPRLQPLLGNDLLHRAGFPKPRREQAFNRTHQGMLLLYTSWKPELRLIFPQHHGGRTFPDPVPRNITHILLHVPLSKPKDYIILMNRSSMRITEAQERQEWSQAELVHHCVRIVGGGPTAPSLGGRTVLRTECVEEALELNRILGSGDKYGGWEVS